MKKILITNNAQMHLSTAGGYSKQLYYLFKIFKEFGYQIYYLMYAFKIYNDESYLKTYTYDELNEIYKKSEYKNIELLDDEIIKELLYLSCQSEERNIDAIVINNISDCYNIDVFFCLGDALVFSNNKENEYKVPSYYWYPCHFYPFSNHDYNGLNSFSNILSLSPSIKIALEQTFPDKKIYYLPHIVEDQEIILSKAEIKQKWNIHVDKYIVLIVCNLNHEQLDNYVVNRKSIDTQLIAFKNFNDKYKNSLLFVHSIKDKYTQVYPLEKLIQKLEFTNENFIWNKNILNELELHELYEMSDILLNCTKAEGFGVPILEAQKYNINAVTNNFCSMKEHNFQDNIADISNYSIHYGLYANWTIPSSDNIFKTMEQIYLYPRRLEPAPRRGAIVQTVTGNLVEESNGVPFEFFNGVNDSSDKVDNNKNKNRAKQNRSKWIVNELTNYTNIKNKLYKIIDNTNP